VAFPRANRLKQRRDFDTVYQKGRRYKSPCLTLRTWRRDAGKRGNPTGDRPDISVSDHPGLPTRIGIAISQKVSKRAVSRNRIKRRIRAALRQLLPEFPSGWDLVITVHPAAMQCDYWGFLQELKQLLMDAEVLNGHS